MVFMWVNLPLKSVPVFYEIIMECLLNCYDWETELIPVSRTLPIRLLLNVIVKIQERDII